VYYTRIHGFFERDGIYKVRIDGSGRENITKDKAMFLNVAGSWIYYQNQDDGSSIYRINIDGSGKEKLNDEISLYLNVVGDWIYYIKDGSIYRIRVDGSDQHIVSDKGGSELNVVGDWIFYRTEHDEIYFKYDMFKIRTDGSEHQLLE